MLQAIDHVAIAVHALDDELPTYRDLLGFDHVATELVEEQKVRVAILQRGEHTVELMEPVTEDSPISRFLERRGPGLHHICLRVDDLEATLARLEAEGRRLIDRVPKPGAHGRRIAFVHPKAAGGVLIELSEKVEA